MKKTIAILLINFCSLLAQSEGNGGMSFLKFGFGARHQATGEALVLTSQDVTGINYNPATLSEYSSPEIAFTHNAWIQDVRSEMLGVSFKLWGLPFAVGVNSTKVPDIEVRTQPGPAQAKFDVNYFSGSLSAAFSFDENISAGLTVKYLYEDMLTDDASGMGFDLGLMYKDIIENLSAGASIRNMGSMDKLRLESTKLPMDYLLGAAYAYPIQEYKVDVSLGAAFQKYRDESGSHINLGAELMYGKTIALRFGYQSGYETKSFTAGLGLIWGRLNLDYAFKPYSLGLGTANIISLKFKF